MLTTIPVITAVVFAVMEACKMGFKNEKFNNFIPILSALLGGILGVCAFFVAPNLVEVGNWLEGGFMGLFSGLVATGSNQIVRQMMQFANTKKVLKNVTTINKTEIDKNGNPKLLQIKEEILDVKEEKTSKSQTIQKPRK